MEKPTRENGILWPLLRRSAPRYLIGLAMLFVVDRVIFKLVFHMENGIGFYAYIMFFIFRHHRHISRFKETFSRFFVVKVIKIYHKQTP